MCFYLISSGSNPDRSSSALSLMEEQFTHNEQGVGSVPAGPTNKVVTNKIVTLKVKNSNSKQKLI